MFWRTAFRAAPAVVEFDHVWWWKNKPPPFDVVNRKGQPCAVTARGALNSVRVEFPDGFTVITSAHAVRLAPVKDQLTLI